MRFQIYASLLTAILGAGIMAPIASASAPNPSPTHLSQTDTPDDQLSDAIFTLQQGMQQLQGGDTQTAIQSFETVLGLSRDLGDRQLEGIALIARGKAYLEQGDSDQATASLQDGLAIAQELNDSEMESLAQQFLAEVNPQ